MKRKTAKEILADSLKELAKTKNVEKLTIKEITGNCGYSSATFYRQFKDKYDLIAWDFAQQLERSMRSLDFEKSAWRQALLMNAQYHCDHKEYLINLFQHTSGVYSFEQYMAEVSVRYLSEFILKNAKELDKLSERCLWAYCYGCVRNCRDWLLGKFDAAPEDMAHIYEMAMPEILKQYFC
ncbi:MAG: TetR/AcrR family transcriptional regulator [bacterium]|nr:TetR/AcrR family transcriptional regulator [bacterium]